MAVSLSGLQLLQQLVTDKLRSATSLIGNVDPNMGQTAFTGQAPGMGDRPLPNAEYIWPSSTPGADMRARLEALDQKGQVARANREKERADLQSKFVDPDEILDATVGEVPSGAGPDGVPYSEYGLVVKPPSIGDRIGQFFKDMGVVGRRLNPVNNYWNTNNSQKATASKQDPEVTIDPNTGVEQTPEAKKDSDASLRANVVAKIESQETPTKEEVARLAADHQLAKIENPTPEQVQAVEQQSKTWVERASEKVDLLTLGSSLLAGMHSKRFGENLGIGILAGVQQAAANRQQEFQNKILQGNLDAKNEANRLKLFGLNTEIAKENWDRVVDVTKDAREGQRIGISAEQNRIDWFKALTARQRLQLSAFDISEQDVKGVAGMLKAFGIEDLPSGVEHEDLAAVIAPTMKQAVAQGMDPQAALAQGVASLQDYGFTFDEQIVGNEQDVERGQATPNLMQRAAGMTQIAEASAVASQAVGSPVLPTDLQVLVMGKWSAAAVQKIDAKFGAGTSAKIKAALEQRR